MMLSYARKTAGGNLTPYPRTLHLLLTRAETSILACLRAPFCPTWPPYWCGATAASGCEPAGQGLDAAVAKQRSCPPIVQIR